MAPTTYTPPINTYVPLESIVLTNAASSVTFFNIPQDYRDLILVANVRLTGISDIGVRFNNDSGNNYHRVWMAGNGSSASSGLNSPETIGYWAYTTSTSYDPQILQLFDYSATDKHKSWLSRYGGASITAGATAGRWASTSAITSINISLGTYQSGSTFSLYALHG